jgi:hypothetical protein
MYNIDIDSILNYVIQNTFFSKLNQAFNIPNGIKDTHIKVNRPQKVRPKI